MNKIKNIVYGLKRTYGVKAILVTTTVPVFDLINGTSSVTDVVHNIRRAVLLPEGSILEISKNLSISPSSTGGVYAKGYRYILIDGKDITITPAQGHRIRIGSVDYQIRTVYNVSDIAYYLEVSVIK